MDNLIVEIIEDYKTYIKKIPKGAEYIADNLREDQINNALNAIGDFSEGVLWLVNVNDVLNNNGINVSLNIEKIKGFLLEINEGLEMQDYVLVADIFEYEISPFFTDLGQVIERGQ